MNIMDKIRKEQCKQDVTDFSTGDTVKVHVRIVEGANERLQGFAGTVIARKGTGIQETFTVRRVVSGQGGGVVGRARLSGEGEAVFCGAVAVLGHHHVNGCPAHDGVVGAGRIVPLRPRGGGSLVTVGLNAARVFARGAPLGAPDQVGAGANGAKHAHDPIPFLVAVIVGF